MFKSNPDDLKEVLTSTESGEWQLPEFQRDFVWTDSAVLSLVASVIKGFPIGALLTLEFGGNIQFKPRCCEGVPEIKPLPTPSVLLLDGQQRITSLYQAFRSEEPVRARSNRGSSEVERYYYLDIRKAFSHDADLEEAIIGVPRNRIVKQRSRIVNDLSKPDFEYKNCMFPLNRVYSWVDWYGNWDIWSNKHNVDISSLKLKFTGLIDSINSYKVATIELSKKNSRAAICKVFEKVNMGGKKLTPFELVTAMYAAQNFNLREDWAGVPKESKVGRRTKINEGLHSLGLLESISSTDFLQTCTLLFTRDARESELLKKEHGQSGRDLPQISCRRQALLDLPLEGYKKFAGEVERGFVQAGRFLFSQSIFKPADIPNTPVVLGLAAVFAILNENELAQPAREKIAHWFWSVTLGELYSASSETRIARDVPALLDWVKDAGKEPDSIGEAVFQQERFQTMRNRNSAAYKGVHALLMKHGAQDFRTGECIDVKTFFHENIDVHHIFPQKWCKDNKKDNKEYDSIVNKTPLSQKTNAFIGGDAPSQYLRRIESQFSISTSDLDFILKTHLIDPTFLRNDDFEGFFRARMNSLSGLVKEAMKKEVIVDQEDDEPEKESEFQDEDLYELLEFN